MSNPFIRTYMDKFFLEILHEEPLSDFSLENIKGGLSCDCNAGATDCNCNGNCDHCKCNGVGSTKCSSNNSNIEQPGPVKP